MSHGTSSQWQTHSFQTPSALEYGYGVTDEIGAFCRSRGVEHAFVVTDDTLVEAGVVTPIVETLADAGVTSEVDGGITTEPKVEMVEALVETIRAGPYDVVVGVGGGSCLDSAKVASVVAAHDLSVRDVVGMDNVPSSGLPLVLLPTTAGTGSEVTNGAVLADPEDGGAKKVVISDHLLPDLALVDPAHTETLPAAIAASTGADALTHAVEAFVSTSRSPMTDALCRDTIETIGDALPEAVHEGSEASRYDMSIAATEAGLGFSNAGLGAVHALTYPIGIECGTPHGLANAILLPYVMAYNVPAEPTRFAEVARLLGRTRDADQSTREFAYEAADAVVELFDSVNLSTALAGIDGLDPADFDEFARVALEHSSHNIEQNPRNLEHADIVTILNRAYRGNLSEGR